MGMVRLPSAFFSSMTASLTNMNQYFMMCVISLFFPKTSLYNFFPNTFLIPSFRIAARSPLLPPASPIPPARSASCCSVAGRASPSA